MPMRPSRVLQQLRAGQVAVSFKLNFSDARIAELAAMLGFDCIWSDMEHIPSDWNAVEQQIWAAKSQGADVMVRVARGSYSDVIRPLEMDAAGIMVPHIMGLEDARQVVRMTRFHPIGRRAVDGGNADAAYCGVPLRAYLEQANAQRFVAIQIEDPEPLEDLEAIAALEGYDILFFGPADFSHGIGAPGQWEHPLVVETRKRIVELAQAHGKIAGTTSSPETFEDLVKMGYRFLNLGADVHAVRQYCTGLMQLVERVRGGER